MIPVVQTKDITIYQGDAQDWDAREHIDIVITNPYGPLPLSLRHHPMVIHQWIHRKREAEQWCRNPLRHLISKWNHEKEAFWSANMEQKILMHLDDYVPEQQGWYPLAMALQIVKVFGRPGMTIWDGFMGRGTIGRAAVSLGMKYVGVEQLPHHITLAREYLDV
jgi:hypothetical protein